MLDHSQHIPLYIQIKGYLKQLISEKKPHEQMPSEPELAAQFKVSRGTVKQAVMELVNEGILYRVQGSGTFVSEPRITRSFNRLPSFTEDIRKSGKGPQTKILAFKQTLPTPYLVSLFHLEAGEKVTKIKRVVSTEDSPIVVLTSYLNPKIYPAAKLEYMKESLYEMLREHYGVVPTKARDTYSIVEVSPKTAALLNCPKSAAVFFSQRISYLPSGEEAEYVESFIRSDRFKLNIFIGTNPEESSSGSQNAKEYTDIGFQNVLL